MPIGSPFLYVEKRSHENTLPVRSISITGVCLFRVVWIFGVFPVWHSLESLYFSYPVSWALTVAMQAACYFIVRKKLLRPAQPSPAL